MLTVVAGLILSAYFFFQESILWPPIAWNGVFISINAYHIRRLLLERRPVQLSESESRLYQMVFRTLTPREFVNLLAVGSWKQAAPKDRLVEQGAKLDGVFVIYSGEVGVEVDGAEVADLDAGCFVGEISFLTGEASTASVVAKKDTEYVTWPMTELRKFLDSNADVRAAWQFTIGTDLVAKLRAA
jgi:CRP-like cAMP-binding protein